MIAPFPLVATDDGSYSCYDAETGELQHNSIGAYTEALEHYCKPSGAVERLKETGSLRVLDACFGLGYNTWVLLDQIIRDPEVRGSLTLVCVEKDPAILATCPLILESPCFNALNFPTAPFEHNTYYQTQPSPHVFSTEVTGRVMIRMEIWCDDLRTVVPSLFESGMYDFVFHDGFSPRKVPELWSVDLFREYHRLLKPDCGKLLTYSTANAVWGGLLDAGFTVYKTAPLGRKAGGTLALSSGDMTPGPLAMPLDSEECRKLEGKAGVPYRDPGMSLDRAEILQNRASEQETLPGH